MTSTPATETQYPKSTYTNLTTSMMVEEPSCKEAMCIFWTVANVIICVLGVTGNGLVIWITGFKVKKTVVSTWYLSLAMSDFLFCSFLPFSVIDVVINDWIFGVFMCKLWAFIMFLNMFSSIFLLVIISVDRCVVVMFPVWAQNQRTTRKASAIVLLAWISSAAFSSPSAIFQHIMQDHETKTCNDENDPAYVICQFIFGFVIPFLIIAICYVIIVRRLNTSQMAKSTKPIKIMTALIATFMICWLPFYTVVLMDLNYEMYSGFLQNVYVYAIILANANSCLNPFLYAFMGKDFKKQCYLILSKIQNAVEEEEGQNTVRLTVASNSGENTLSNTSVQ